MYVIVEGCFFHSNSEIHLIELITAREVNDLVVCVEVDVGFEIETWRRDRGPAIALG